MTNLESPPRPPISGRDHYAELYQAELELQSKWLRYGAAEKVNSIEALMDRHAIDAGRILELGCGTGAVIMECQRRGLGRHLTAIDYSNEAIQYLQSHSSGIRCQVADITDLAFPLEGCYDVVILSHVLEHLEQPLMFLHSLLRRLKFRYLVAEVPLEDLWASRIKHLFKDRSANPAGHVQWFTRRTFVDLVSSAGLQVIDDRRYVPILSPEVIDFVCRKDRLSNTRRLIKHGTNFYLPRLLKPLWERVYHAHYAVLCVPAGNSPDRQ